jgi:hypothetical protein
VVETRVLELRVKEDSSELDLLAPVDVVAEQYGSEFFRFVEAGKQGDQGPML